MDVQIESLLDGARRATGNVAVIDVFRAFTTAAVALANGARRIIMVAGVTEALALRERGIGEVCLGEEHGHAPVGFDFGNSPYEISGVNFAGKTLIQRTSAGTQGIVAAIGGADRLYAASLATAAATARALRQGAPERVTLVAMGNNGASRADEDELCAVHLRNLVEDRPGDPEAVCRLIRAGGEIARFRDPTRPYYDPRDLDFALDVGRYDFAIRVTLEGRRPVARIERPL